MGAHGTLEEALASVSSFAEADAQNELALRGSKDGKRSRKSSKKKSSKKADRKHEQIDRKKVQVLTCTCRSARVVIVSRCPTISRARSAIQLATSTQQDSQGLGRKRCADMSAVPHILSITQRVMQEKDSKKAKHGKRSKSSMRSKSRRESSPESGSGSDSDSGGSEPAGRKPQGGLQVELARARHAARCTRELLLQYPEQRRDLRQVLLACCATQCQQATLAE